AQVLPHQTLATPRTLSPSEVNGIRTFSRSYAYAVEHAPALGSVDLDPGDANAMERAHLRAAILQRLQHEHVTLAAVHSLDVSARDTAERVDRDGAPLDDDP